MSKFYRIFTTIQLVFVICEITRFSGNVDKIDITGDRVDEVKIKLGEASSMAGYLRLSLAGSVCNIFVDICVFIFHRELHLKTC